MIITLSFIFNQIFTVVTLMTNKIGYSFVGPKGVINDWRKYKQLEVEQKQEQKKEMERLIKKLSMTCRSELDMEKDKDKQKELQDKIKGKVSRMGTKCIHGERNSRGLHFLFLTPFWPCMVATVATDFRHWPMAMLFTLCD